MAAKLGTPLLPWQRYVADVAGERLPSGEYAYQIVVVTVPRQSGKTVLIRSVGCQRAAVLGRDTFYTAQKGKDASARFDDLTHVIRKSPWRKRCTVYRAAGKHRIQFDEGGVFQAFAPTPDSLHGYTPPCVMLDEAFAHSPEDGEMLMQAIGPAQLTLRDRQLWIVSTAGTAESTWFKAWVDKAVGGADRVAGFVWAAPDDLAPMSVEGIESYHPGVGFEMVDKTGSAKVLTAADVLANTETESKAAYLRGYGNRWTRTSSSLISADRWAALAVDQLPPDKATPPVLTYDVAHDMLSSTLLATWQTPEGPTSRVVMAAAGSSWLVDTVVDLVDRWELAAVAADDGGPSRDVTDALVARGVDVRTLSGRELSTSTARILRMIEDGELSHDGSEILEVAATSIVTAPTGDGVSVSRRHSPGDVSAFVALVVGVWVLDHREAPAPAPAVYFGRTA